jgi:hypothetical protein
MFSCNICNYVTEDKSNWKRHIKSNKHKNMINEVDTSCGTFNIIKHECAMCNKFFCDKKSLDAHIKLRCKVYLQLVNDDIVKQEFYKLKCANVTLQKEVEHWKSKVDDVNMTLQKEVEHWKSKVDDVSMTLQKEVEHWKSKVDNVNITLQKEVEHLKSKVDAVATMPQKEVEFWISKFDDAMNIAKNSTSTADKIVSTTSTMKYLTTNHKETPPLLQLTHGKGLSMIRNDVETYNEKFKNVKDIIKKDIMLAEILITKFKNKKLSKYIASIIENNYKTINPLNQQFWNTDSSRQNYIVRDTKCKWINDKHGEKLKLKLISRFSHEIIDLINVWIAHVVVDKNNLNEHTTLFYANAVLMMADLKDGTIDDETLKKLSPKFYFDKTMYDKSIKKSITHTMLSEGVNDSDSDNSSNSNDSDNSIHITNSIKHKIVKPKCVVRQTKY